MSSGVGIPDGLTAKRENTLDPAYEAKRGLGGSGTWRLNPGFGTIGIANRRSCDMGVLFHFDYSYRRAMAGSTPAALRAGIALASSVTSRRVRDAAIIRMGSRELAWLSGDQ